MDILSYVSHCSTNFIKLKLYQGYCKDIKTKFPRAVVLFLQQSIGYEKKYTSLLFKQYKDLHGFGIQNYVD